MSADIAKPWVEPVLQLLRDARETEALAAIRSELGHAMTDELHFAASQGKTDEARDRARLANLYGLAEFLLDHELWAEAATAFAWTIKLSEEMDEVFFLDNSRFSKAFCHKMLGHRREMLKATEVLPADQTYFVGVRGVFSIRDLLD